MFTELSHFKKAAIINAAFFIFVSSAGARAISTSFESVRTKATNLLIQKQKKQALQVVANYMQNESNKNSVSEASEFMLTLAQTFISKDAQEAYESSINFTLDNPKESLQAIEICLQLEPQNSDCLIQKLRLAVRAKNKTLIERTHIQITQAVPNTSADTFTTLIIKKDETDFKTKNFVKRLIDKPGDEDFVLTVLELDRAFDAKNFSRAKDVIQYLEKHFSDWPDILYYKQKIDLESVENKIVHSTEINTLYAAKCKSLSKSTARKYRYDFELCARGS